MSLFLYFLLEWIPSWKFLLFVIFTLIFVLCVRKSESARLIDEIPGPRSAFIVGNLFMFLFKSHAEHYKMLHGLFKEYVWAPMFRMWICGKPYVLVTKAVTAEKILNSSREINKGEFYEFLEPWLGLGLLTSNGKKWYKHRKLLTPSFHFGILEQFVPIFNEQSAILVTKLNEHVDKGHFDISKYVSLCTLDVICETAMGRKIEAQVYSDSEYAKAVHEMGRVSFDRVSKPWLQISWIFNLSSHKRSQDKCLRILHTFSQRIIEEKKKSLKETLKDSNKNVSEVKDDGTLNGIYGLKKRKAFLDTLLEARGEDGIGLTDVEIREEVDTFMFEGHDTTSVAISWILFCLGCHPEVQEQVHDELDRVFGDDLKSVAVADMKELKYLEAVIKETLRLFPSVPVFSRTLVKDVEMGGYKVPKGTDIIVAVQAIHSDPKYYDDPYTFNPSRFLGDQRVRNPFAYIPFSAGPRNCIGQKFAIMELKVILCHILKNFQLSSLEKFDEIEAVDALVLLPMKGVQMCVRKRVTKSKWVAED